MTERDRGDASVTESALIVAVPEADPVVGRLRDELDYAAALGVPAHVTVISPFVPPDRIDDDVLTALTDMFGAVSAFDATFAGLSWFGEQVLWLTPEPAARFRELTRLAWQRYRDCPPYGGVYDDVVPHLTVGVGQPIDLLREAARSVEPELPLRSRVTKVTLLQGSMRPGSWRIRAEFPLGDSPGPSSAP